MYNTTLTLRHARFYENDLSMLFPKAQRRFKICFLVLRRRPPFDRLKWILGFFRDNEKVGGGGGGEFLLLRHRRFRGFFLLFSFS